MFIYTEMTILFKIIYFLPAYVIYSVSSSSTFNSLCVIIIKCVK